MIAPAHSLHAPPRPTPCNKVRLRDIFAIARHQAPIPTRHITIQVPTTARDEQLHSTKQCPRSNIPSILFIPPSILRTAFPTNQRSDQKGKGGNRWSPYILPYVKVVPIRPLSDGMTALEKAQVYYTPHEMRALRKSAKKIQKKVFAVAPDLTAEACLEIDGLRGMEAAVSPEITRNRAMAVRAVMLSQRKLRSLSDRGKDRDGVGDNGDKNAAVSIADPTVFAVWTERKAELLAEASTKASQWARDVARERGRRDFWWAYPDKDDGLAMLGRGERLVTGGIMPTAKYGVIGGKEGGVLVPSAMSVSVTDSGDRGRDD